MKFPGKEYTPVKKFTEKFADGEQEWLCELRVKRVRVSVPLFTGQEVSSNRSVRVCLPRVTQVHVLYQSVGMKYDIQDDQICGHLMGKYKGKFFL